METFNIQDILKKKLEKPKKKIDFEFQDVCLQCEEFFGKNKLIWTQPYRKGVDENLLRYALKECMTRKKPFIGYFLKIVNNKLNDKKVQKM